MKDMYSPTGWENILETGEKHKGGLEYLLWLIDNFAETRHTCGHWTDNLKSSESRQKVIAALKMEI